MPFKVSSRSKPERQIETECLRVRKKQDKTRAKQEEIEGKTPEKYVEAPKFERGRGRIRECESVIKE